MVDCPSAQDLERFLAGSLPDPVAGPLGEHVRACAACQARLETLSDDPELRRWWADRAASGDESPTEPALARLLGKWRGAAPAPGPADTDPGNQAPFLGPPREGGDLGTLGPYRDLPIILHLKRRMVPTRLHALPSG
jgi:hypothetical protein